jgi:hypothetical protein
MCFDGNDTLVLNYEDGDETRPANVTIKLPHGNRSVDDIVVCLNDGRLDEYVASYDENTNRLTFEGTDNVETILIVMPGTICKRMLGLDVGAMASMSDDFRLKLVGGRIVDLTRTSSVFVHSNLLTQNHDPRTRRVGDITAKIPSSAQFNEIDHFSSDAFVYVYN